MNTIVKVCKKHGDLQIENVFESLRRGKVLYLCKICRYEQAARAIARNMPFEKTGICKVHGKLEEKDIGSLAQTCNGKTWIRKRCRLCHRKTSTQAQKLNPEKTAKKNAQGRLRYSLTLDKERKRSKVKYRKTEKQCMEGHIKRSYGLSPEDYYKMKEEQNNKCKICGNPETRKSCTKGKICRLAIDHNHSTGKARALLCHSCNTGIGKFKENIDLMLSAIEYLKSHQ